MISEPSILTLAINEVLLISQYTVSDGLNLLIAATIPHTDQPIRRFAVFTTIFIGIYADLLGTEDGGDQFNNFWISFYSSVHNSLPGLVASKKHDNLKKNPVYGTKHRLNRCFTNFPQSTIPLDGYSKIFFNAYIHHPRRGIFTIYTCTYF